MTAFDYVFPLLLILSVLRQVRGRPLTWFQFVWPLALVGWAVVTYVRGFPSTTDNAALVVACAVVGVVLGAFAGRCTVVFRGPDGAVMAKATRATVVLWTMGTAGRLVFGLYAENGGGPGIAAFSTAHGLAITAWASALTLMALAEILGRTVTLAPRAIAAAHTVPPKTF